MMKINKPRRARRRRSAGVGEDWQTYATLPIKDNVVFVAEDHNEDFHEPCGLLTTCSPRRVISRLQLVVGENQVVKKTI